MQLLITLTCGLICLSAISAAPTEEQMENVKEVAKMCVEKTGVDPIILKNPASAKETDQMKMACFSACVMQKIGLMDAAGNMNVEIAKEHIPENFSKEDANNLIDLCFKEKGSNECETAGLVVKCIMDKKGDEILGMIQE